MTKYLRSLSLQKAFLLGGGVIGGWIVLYLLYILITLPNVDEVGALFAAESTVITDRHGTELYRIHGDEDRTLVPLSEISDYVEQATIAIEDSRFYERGCFDPRAFMRAVVGNIVGGYGSQGGSTITQQFSKNALIGSRKKRITRKLKEYILSCKLENRYSKDEVLELYLNRIPYGHNAHGAEQAAKIYFAKSALGLTLAEASILAALPQLPSYLSPYGQHVRTTLSEKGKERVIRGKIKTLDDVKDDDFWIGLAAETFDAEGNPLGPNSTGGILTIGGRTDQVLKNMEDQGFISEEERLAALEELQTISFKRARENIRAPHFVINVREQIEQDFADQFERGFLESGGLTVTTSLDWELQEIAEDVISEIGQLNIDLYDAHNAALISADPKSGHILAYVGNRDYWDEVTDGNVDIVRAPRQPGSSFKPFAYAAAFLNGYSPATVLYDVPTKIGEDEPENFDGQFWGPLTIRKALGASRNIPAAKSFFLAGGEDAIVSLASAMGVPTVSNRKEELSAARGEAYEYGWPLALGAAEIPLYEMVQGYTTFARGGTSVPLVSILKIEDRLGNILYETSAEPEEQEALDERIAYMITSVLSDESVRPEPYWRSQLSVSGYQTAAKTGTSNKCLKRAGGTDDSLGVCIDSKPDNTWTIGYTPNLIAGAWAGNASGGALFPKASGLDTASHIWKRYMTAAHAHFVKEYPSIASRFADSFPIPEKLSSAQISELSGKLASQCTPESYRRAEIFLEDEAPKEFDDACSEIEVDKLTGLLASDECPRDALIFGPHFSPRSSMPERWPQWEAAVQEWAKQVSSGTGSLYWKVVGERSAVSGELGATRKVLRGSGAFLPLPLPLAPTEECWLDLTPGRLIKPTLRILSPSDGGSATAPSFMPRFSYSTGNGVRDVQIELDGRIVAHSSSGSLSRSLLRKEGTSDDMKVRLSRRFNVSGQHQLKITLTDSYFNTVTDSVRFQFEEDKGVPQVTILSPQENASLTIGSTVTIRAVASDSSGIDRVQFFLGDQLITTRRTSPFEATFTVSGEPGSSSMSVVARDTGGNEGVDEIGVELAK